MGVTTYSVLLVGGQRRKVTLAFDMSGADSDDTGGHQLPGPRPWIPLVYRRSGGVTFAGMVLYHLQPPDSTTASESAFRSEKLRGGRERLCPQVWLSMLKIP